MMEFITPCSNQCSQPEKLAALNGVIEQVEAELVTRAVDTKQTQERAEGFYERVADTELDKTEQANQIERRQRAAEQAAQTALWWRDQLDAAVQQINAVSCLAPNSPPCPRLQAAIGITIEHFIRVIHPGEDQA